MNKQRICAYDGCGKTVPDWRGSRAKFCSVSCRNKAKEERRQQNICGCRGCYNHIPSWLGADAEFCSINCLNKEEAARERDRERGRKRLQKKAGPFYIPTHPIDSVFTWGIERDGFEHGDITLYGACGYIDPWQPDPAWGF